MVFHQSLMPRAPPAMASKHTKQSVFDDLRWRIISLNLPPGADLDESELVREYGISRTPIRETLIRLQGEGLVVLKQNRGAYVTPLDFAALQAYFEAAVFISRAVTRLAASRRTAADLARIHDAQAGFEAALAARDTGAMVRENNRFHEAIGNAAGNGYLFSAYRRLLADHERIATILYQHELDEDDAAAQSLTIAQHEKISAAIERRDPDTAERISTQHLEFCREGLTRVLDRSRHSLSDIRIDTPRAGSA